jgi:hypothetical protein
MIGAGTQFLAIVFCIFMLALVGVFYPYNRGALYTASIVLYALTAGISGYVSAGFYKQMGGTRWVRFWPPFCCGYFGRETAIVGHDIERFLLVFCITWMREGQLEQAASYLAGVRCFMVACCNHSCLGLFSHKKALVLIMEYSPWLTCSPLVPFDRPRLLECFPFPSFVLHPFGYCFAQILFQSFYENPCQACK